MAFNYFGHLMEEFSKAGVIVTERPPKQIGLVNVRGNKIGENIFARTVKAYIEDKFCRNGGLSINGFLNNMDRLASKTSLKTQAEIEEEKKKASLERTSKYLEKIRSTIPASSDFNMLKEFRDIIKGKTMRYCTNCGKAYHPTDKATTCDAKGQYGPCGGTIPPYQPKPKELEEKEDQNSKV